MLWLTPVSETASGWVLSKERTAYEESVLTPVLAVLREVHPRLVPLVKAAILPDEPEAEEVLTCGTAADFTLSMPGDIVFDGKRWQLSHCGESFFDMLLPVNEAWMLFESVSQIPEEINDCITRWMRHGMHPIVIKE